MPPKAKELRKVPAVQVFSLDNMNPSLLPELATFKKIQLKVVKENPFVLIIDATSRDLAKKHRTARVSARTSLQGQDKLISAKFNEAKTKAKTYIAELIALTQEGELEQQKEIDRDESVLEEKRQEKARLEQARIDNIKNEIDTYVSQWKSAFNIMVFDTVEEVGSIFLESYTNYDITVLEEFESLFPTKVQELTEYLHDKTISLTNEEMFRVEKIRVEDESKKLAEQNAKLLEEKAELERLVKLAEAKAIADREAFEKEKADFAAKQAEVARQLESSKKAQIEAEIKAKREAEAKSITAPEAIKVIEPEILVPDLTTANVCTSLQPETLPDTIAYDLPKSTWKSIEEDFKNSSYKSYSKFLVDNYKVPTKLI
jgi:colicin import membrane protein